METKKENITSFSTDSMLRELGEFDPIIFKYYYGKDPTDVQRCIEENPADADKYAKIVEYESSQQFACLTKQNYADDYANLNLVYGEQGDTLRNINLMELVSTKWISQYINIDGMERLFSETYIEFEWEMHLSADYKKHNMKFYRDHFFHQVKDTYMMYMLLKNHGFYECVKDILLNESISKVSRFVCRSLVQQKYHETELVRKLRSEKDDPEFYIRNMIYMAAFMAGLFHDIGYPESYYMITSRHIRDYIASIHELNSEESSINRIYALLQNSLLFRVEPFEIIEKRIKNTQKPDHGALSAVIFLLHFYENGAIYTLPPYKKAAVELAALAIYNHTNKYGIQNEKEYTIYRPCFSLNPISYLLRICDDLQEWERIYFVVSDKSNIVICNKCKTPIIGFREERKGEIISRYRCNCQFVSKKGKRFQNDDRESDCYVQAFDGVSKFSYRRLYNVSVCDSVMLEGNAKSDRKVLFRLHYDPYKLLHVAYLNGTYAKYRISELNSLKRLFECQKGIPGIYLDYFVTSNPVHIKVKILEEYLAYKYGAESELPENGKKWKKSFIQNIMQVDIKEEDFKENNFEKWLDEKVEKIQEQVKNIKEKFLEMLKADFSEEVRDEYEKSENDSLQSQYVIKIETYLDMALELYSKLLVYQWTNEYLNNYQNESSMEERRKKYEKYKDFLLTSEWRFAKQYFYSPELRCMIEDCFLQFTRMYLDIREFEFFPDEYYKQYENGEREKIFRSQYTDDTGKVIEEDIARDGRYFHESEEYYYKALSRYMDAELYHPINMGREADGREINVIEQKIVDAYTDLYLFYLFDREIKGIGV